ncbi:MAG: hypothetical protein LUF02_09200 [Erysipelotrichaceae bacterium]|nr:hypothetical protein [Erysipelotrichaceae bacterium]
MIISQTDAYSIGIPGPKQTFQFVGIPIPELKMIICEVRRRNDKDMLLFNYLRQRIEESL